MITGEVLTDRSLGTASEAATIHGSSRVSEWVLVFNSSEAAQTLQTIIPNFLRAIVNLQKKPDADII